MNLSAVILAGGQSRRMGRDKAWLEVEGEPLLARQIRIVRALNPAEVFISGRAGEDYSALNCPVLLDREPGFGPLGGIECALQSAGSPLVLVMAVDLPFMTTDFLRKLCGQCAVETGAVPQLNGKFEPLAAIYPKRCHALVCDFIARSRNSAREFAEACLNQGAVRSVPVASSDAACFTNWNRPTDTKSTK